VFYEHQLQHPWTDGAEQRLFQETLEQVELAVHLALDVSLKQPKGSRHGNGRGNGKEQ
jgi:hypothetical protein